MEKNRFVFWGKESEISDLGTARLLKETLALALKLEEKHPLWQISVSFELPQIFIVDTDNKGNIN